MPMVKSISSLTVWRWPRRSRAHPCPASQGPASVYAPARKVVTKMKSTVTSVPKHCRGIYQRNLWSQCSFSAFISELDTSFKSFWLSPAGSNSRRMPRIGEDRWQRWRLIIHGLRQVLPGVKRSRGKPLPSQDRQTGDGKERLAEAKIGKGRSESLLFRTKFGR